MEEPNYEEARADQEDKDDAMELQSLDRISSAGDSPAGGIGAISSSSMPQQERVIKILTEPDPELKELISNAFNLSNLDDDDIEHIVDGVEVYLHWKRAGLDYLCWQMKCRIHAFLQLKRSKNARERELLATQIISLFRGKGQKQGSMGLGFGQR